MNFTAKLLIMRKIERVLSFSRLIGIIGGGTWLGYGLLNILQNHMGDLQNGQLVLNKSDTWVVIGIVCAMLVVAVSYFSAPYLAKWRVHNDHLIDDFEDTARHRRKRQAREGQIDENGEMNVNILLKRGSNEPMEELETLIGLKNVKEEVRKIQAVFEYENKHKTTKKGHVCRHYAFLGNPGTGKTTVARVFAGLLYQNHRIKYNMYLECTGNDLTGEYAGQTKTKVNAIYKKAKGGVLFIDEAYILCQGRGGSMAEEAIAQLLVHMESDPYTVIIFAGYTNNMREFLSMNPGLTSRVSRQVTFPDYSPEELMQICKRFCANSDMILSGEAEGELLKVFTLKQVTTVLENTSFSNGRYARNCFDVIYQQHAMNAAETDADDELYNIVTEDDVKQSAEELSKLE